MCERLSRAAGRCQRRHNFVNMTDSEMIPARSSQVPAPSLLRLPESRAQSSRRALRSGRGQNRLYGPSSWQVIPCSACGRITGQQKHSYDTRGKEVVTFRCWHDPSSCWPKFGPLRRTKSLHAFVRDWSRSPPCEFPDFMEQEIHDWVQAHRTCCSRQQ